MVGKKHGSIGGILLEGCDALGSNKIKPEVPAKLACKKIFVGKGGDEALIFCGAEMEIGGKIFAKNSGEEYLAFAVEMQVINEKLVSQGVGSQSAHDLFLQGNEYEEGIVLLLTGIVFKCFEKGISGSEGDGVIVLGFFEFREGESVLPLFEKGYTFEVENVGIGWIFVFELENGGVCVC